MAEGLRRYQINSGELESGRGTALSRPLGAYPTATGRYPGASEDDAGKSLLEIARECNRDMQCPGGKDKVLVIDRMQSNGRLMKEGAHVGMECPVRGHFGLPKYIGLDYIRKVCCQKREGCSSFKTLMDRVRGNYLSDNYGFNTTLTKEPAITNPKDDDF